MSNGKRITRLLFGAAVCLLAPIIYREIISLFMTHNVPLEGLAPESVLFGNAIELSKLLIGSLVAALIIVVPLEVAFPLRRNIVTICISMCVAGGNILPTVLFELNFGNYSFSRAKLMSESVFYLLCYLVARWVDHKLLARAGCIEERNTSIMDR